MQSKHKPMPKKMKHTGDPAVHEELKGFEIKINEFGVMETSYNIDSLNEFLNENVEDKKLKDRQEEE